MVYVETIDEIPPLPLDLRILRFMNEYLSASFPYIFQLQVCDESTPCYLWKPIVCHYQL